MISSDTLICSRFKRCGVTFRPKKKLHDSFKIRIFSNFDDLKWNFDYNCIGSYDKIHTTCRYDICILNESNLQQYCLWKNDKLHVYLRMNLSEWCFRQIVLLDTGTESTQSDVLWFTWFSLSVDYFREVKKYMFHIMIHVITHFCDIQLIYIPMWFLLWCMSYLWNIYWNILWKSIYLNVCCLNIFYQCTVHLWMFYASFKYF